ncbi:hypothetical protein TSAR_008935 [Trichomalopsis sarcophagae]|uniref:Uncharacterized protein n=1 Tax=Trichomalopsis sarcophagae TaxID=543379 RepID=A0A232FIB8_9HYME|nr:hypothetical protein TSAR_008935 [Trichomalopsis sarcophagae]
MPIQRIRVPSGHTIVPNESGLSEADAAQTRCCFGTIVVPYFKSCRMRKSDKKPKILVLLCAANKAARITRTGTKTAPGLCCIGFPQTSLIRHEQLRGILKSICSAEFDAEYVRGPGRRRPLMKGRSTHASTAWSHTWLLTLSLGSVDSSVYVHLQNCRTPKEITDKISSLYGTKSQDARDKALQEFCDLKFKDGVSVALQLEQFEDVCR